MTRNLKQILALSNSLDKMLEKQADLFFKDRPFLEDPEAPKIITDSHTDDEILEKTENDIAIEETTKQLKILINKL